jgi:hypothetical protein
MSNLAVHNDGMLASLVLGGDLAKMNDGMKVDYYRRFCDSLGLNPLTQPFKILKFQGKEVLYATKDCTEQLRKLHGVSVIELGSDFQPQVTYMVTCKVKDKDGKTDVATGVVSIEGLKGEALANAMMKAETKAKRRATLSICGLGMLDESEIETVDAHATVVSVPLEPDKRKISEKAFGAAIERIKAGEQDVIGKLRESFHLSDEQAQVLLQLEDLNQVPV